MSIPKEPRQMMINMMYLVLTALLALNVSAEILNAFHVVNEGIVNSNISVDNKNAKAMEAFQSSMEKDAAKTKPWMDKANAIKDESEKIIKEIDEITDEIVKQTGGWTDEAGNHFDTGWSSEKGHLADEKNLDVSTRLMVEEKKGYELQDKLIELRKKIIDMIEDPVKKKEIEAQLPLNVPPKDQMFKNAEGQSKDWVNMNFHMIPTIAAITLLNKFKNDIKNSESMMIDYFLQQINAKDFKFDKLTARVIAPTSYVMQGQKYTADIFVAAFNSTQNPEVIIGPLNANAKKDPDGGFLETKENPVNGGKTIEVKGGMGKYEVAASGEGEQKYSGAVKVVGPDGTPTYYPFEAAYTSAKGSAVVSSDNLNIIYAGVPNPFSVSVPGFSADKVTATANVGSFTGSKGKYVANMAATDIGKKVTITVTVDDQGTKKTIGSSEFLIKRIPDPQAVVAGKFEGSIKTGELKSTPGVIAQLKDFYFQGVTFNITSFEFIFIAKRQDPWIAANTGMKWSPEILSKIQGAKPGDQIIIRSIKAKGPDGQTRSLNPISLTIN
jgi:hypothetical protein